VIAANQQTVVDAAVRRALAGHQPTANVEQHGASTSNAVAVYQSAASTSTTVAVGPPFSDANAQRLSRRMAVSCCALLPHLMCFSILQEDWRSISMDDWVTLNLMKIQMTFKYSNSK
jgi:hypothetical protein